LQQSSHEALTSATAVPILSEACRIAGIPTDGARLIRLGENALFRIPDASVIVRIARGPDVLGDAQKEVAVSAWLHEMGIPAARTTEHDQPIMAQGHPVTFWRPVPESGARATVSDLGLRLKAIHALPIPGQFALPELDMFGRVDVRIDRAIGVPLNDRRFLRQRLDELRSAYNDLRFPSSPCVVHGDPHIANLIQTPDGEAVVIDFERFAVGNPETDLAVTAAEFEIGWHTESDYEHFCESYGQDVREWVGFEVLRDIHLLKMTTWLMQNVVDGPAIEVEFTTRLATLRGSAFTGRWRPY